MKLCTGCKTEKNFSEFNVRRASKDGLAYKCKDCKRAQYQKWREENKEYKAQLDSAYYQNNKEKRREYVREYKRNRLQDPEYRERISQQNAAWYQANKQERNEYVSGWRRENRDATRRHRQVRRARENEALVPGEPIPELWQLKLLYGSECIIPGCTAEADTIDHIVPISKGGKHTFANTQPMCKSHNCSKRNRNSNDYRLEVKQWQGTAGLGIDAIEETAKSF